ncbi:Spindly [Pelobates cultripes]|uniref:Spindly n=1 Tax=Pelobates cultripes TaxID=61616 RepID=A0AAD1RTK2_PELCU|nr:Spindly [Pelobates cultripes]
MLRLNESIQLRHSVNEPALNCRTVEQKLPPSGQQNSETDSSGINRGNLGQGDETFYVDLLKMKLENSCKEIEKIKDELSLQRMKALAESQRVLELERKLFTNERHLKLSQGENMKLRVSLDEIKMKYEPDEMVKLRIQKRRREQLPLDCPSEDAPDNVPAGNSVDVSNAVKEEEGCTTEPSANGSSEDHIVSVEEQLVDSVSINQKKPTNVQPVKERKRVRIMEDENQVHSFNKSSTNDCSVASSPPRSASDGLRSEDSRFETKKLDEREMRKNERKSRIKAQPVLHVSSKPASVTQCPQQ